MKINHCADIPHCSSSVREIVSISAWKEKECTWLYSNSSISEERTAIATGIVSLLFLLETVKAFGLCRPEDCFSFSTGRFRLSKLVQYRNHLSPWCFSRQRDSTNKMCRVNCALVVTFFRFFLLFFYIFYLPYRLKLMLFNFM